MKRFSCLFVKVKPLSLVSTSKVSVSSSVVSSLKSSHLLLRHHNSSLLVLTRNASGGFLNAQIRDAQLIAKKAEKEYSIARFEEKGLRNRLNILKAELEELDGLEDPEDDKEFSELEHRRATVLAKIHSVEAQLDNAVLKEESCFMQLSSSLHGSIDRELYREWKYKTRTLFASLVGCVAGLVLSVFVTSKHIDDGVHELKQVVNEASIEALVTGVEQALVKSQKNYGDLSDGLDELNSHLSRNSTADSIPHVIHEFENLKEHVHGIEESVCHIDERSSTIVETLEKQSEELKHAMEDHHIGGPTTAPVNFDAQMQLIVDKIITQLNQTMEGNSALHLHHEPSLYIHNDPDCPSNSKSDVVNRQCGASNEKGHGPCYTRPGPQEGSAGPVTNSHVRQAMIIGIFSSFLFYILHG